MEEDEEDRILLRRLGVDSANPEDIERDILGKVTIPWSLGSHPYSFMESFLQMKPWSLNFFLVTSLTPPHPLAWVKTSNTSPLQN